MKLTTTHAQITPMILIQYLKALCDTELSVDLLPTCHKSYVELEVNLDGADHNSTKIYLFADGTWEASTHLVIREAT